MYKMLNRRKLWGRIRTSSLTQQSENSMTIDMQKHMELG